MCFFDFQKNMHFCMICGHHMEPIPYGMPQKPWINGGYPLLTHFLTRFVQDEWVLIALLRGTNSMYHKNGRCESSCLRESLEAKYLLKTRKNVFLDTLDVPVDKSEHFMKKYFWVKKSPFLLIFTFHFLPWKKKHFWGMC